MNLAKIDTAKSFLVGPILDADGVAVTTTLTRANINVSKNGTVAASNASSTLTHSHTGNWVFAANASDISALGEVEFSLNATTNAMKNVSFQVVTANIYDSFSSTDILQSDLIQMGGVVQSATDLKDFADAGYDPATNKVVGVKLADDLTTGTIATYTGNTKQTADNDTKLTAILEDVTGLNGDVMRGTDGANTVVPDVAGTAPTSAEIVTAMEADAGDLSSLMEALVNKRIWTEASGDLEMFNDAGSTQGTVSAQVTSDGTFTTAKRAFI